MKSPTVNWRIPILIIVSMSSFDSCRLLPPPSDSSMEHLFFERKQDFEELRRLIFEDSGAGIVEMVFIDYTSPNLSEASRRGFSKARLRTYLELLHRLGLRGVMRLGDYIVLEASVTGLLTGGTYKGFLYTPKPPSHLERLLDDVHGGNCDYLARPLQGKWYLYFRDCTTHNSNITHGS